MMQLAPRKIRMKAVVVVYFSTPTNVFNFNPIFLGTSCTINTNLGYKTNKHPFVEDISRTKAAIKVEGGIKTTSAVKL